MMYVEMTLEEAMARCDKNDKVLVAVQDLSDCNNSVIAFVRKKREEYPEIFADIQTAYSIRDDFVNQLRLFTTHQNVSNIKPVGLQKTVLIE